MLLLNKITLNSSSTVTDVLNLCAFADDITILPESPGSGSGDQGIFSVRYIPEGLSATAYKTVLRQDAKTVNLTPLSTAVYGQGMVVNETFYGSSTESFFLNSIVFSLAVGGTQPVTFRVGVSNFTQTQDNNPFSSIDAANILYFEV